MKINGAVAQGNSLPARAVSYFCLSALSRGDIDALKFSFIAKVNDGIARRVGRSPGAPEKLPQHKPRSPR